MQPFAFAAGNGHSASGVQPEAFFCVPVKKVDFTSQKFYNFMIKGMVKGH